MPVGELTTDKSTVIHAKSKRRISYGDVAKFAKVPAELPKIAEGDLKKPQGLQADRPQGHQAASMCRPRSTARARYGIDVQVPGMVYASLLHSPMDGAKVASVNADDVKKIKGVTHVLSLPFGVAVVADTVEASRARPQRAQGQMGYAAQPRPRRSTPRRPRRSTPARPRIRTPQAMEAFKTGDADKAFAGAAKTLEAVYWSEHTYHAQMEPMNAVATVSDGRHLGGNLGRHAGAAAGRGGRVPARSRPRRTRSRSITQLLGGGFGRRIWPDAPVQATVISNIVKKPVKLMLTREDDIAAARPRPMTHHVMKAGLDDKKNLVSWHHRIVAENVDAVAAPPRFAATKGRDYIGWVGMSQDFYNIPNLKADAIREERGMRVHAWRGIGAGYNKFVSESFLDEVAQARGVDPLDYRLELTKDHPRAQAVIKAVAEMSNYKKKRRGPGSRHRVLRLSRHADGGRRRGVGRQGDRQDQGPQLLDRGRRRAWSSSPRTHRRRSKARSCMAFPARCRRSCR